MPKIDPIERALDAYSALDTDQKLIFGAAVRHIERAIAQLSHSVDYCAPQDETKRRGRPPGSKNRKTVPAIESDGILAHEFLHNNGAITEEL